MKRIVLVLAVVVLALSAFVWYEATQWFIPSDGYTIRFTSKNPNGVFTNLTGDIFFDESHLPVSRFDVTVDVNSINTGNKLKNKHARSAKWFDAEKYPQIKFTSSKFSRNDTAFVVTGILDMHGVQKEISFPFQYSIRPEGGALFTAGFDVNRNDYHIGKPGRGVAEILHIDLNVPVDN